MEKELQVELSIFSTRKWYSFFDVFNSVSLAIRYDEAKYVAFKNGYVYKINSNKIKKKITHTETIMVSYASYFFGKIWLDSCIIGDKRFKDSKEFGLEYARSLRGFEECVVCQ